MSRSWNLGLDQTECVVMRLGRGIINGEGSGSGYYKDRVDLRLIGLHRHLGVFLDRIPKFHRHVSTIVNEALGLSNQVPRATVNLTRYIILMLVIFRYSPLLGYRSEV